MRRTRSGSYQKCMLMTAREGCRLATAQGVATAVGRGGGDGKGRLTVGVAGGPGTPRKQPLKKLKAALAGLPKSNETPKCEGTFLAVHAVKVLLPTRLAHLLHVSGISVGICWKSVLTRQ